MNYYSVVTVVLLHLQCTVRGSAAHNAPMLTVRRHCMHEIPSRACPLVTVGGTRTGSATSSLLKHRPSLAGTDLLDSASLPAPGKPEVSFFLCSLCDPNSVLAPPHWSLKLAFSLRQLYLPFNSDPSKMSAEDNEVYTRTTAQSLRSELYDPERMLTTVPDAPSEPAATPRTAWEPSQALPAPPTLFVSPAAPAKMIPALRSRLS